MRKLAILLIALLGCAWAQQPQTQSVPDYAANARYLQGYGGGGYAPSCTSSSGKCPGSDLVLHIGKGTAICNLLGVPSKVEYAGGTLTLTNSATNYVYVAPCSTATPSFSTSAFAHVALYAVVASAGVIQSISEARGPVSETQLPQTGNSNVIVSGSGTFTASRCLHTDASGNAVIAAADCGSGSGSVTTTGSPASGNLTKFSASTSVTNADLTGDITTSGTVATTLGSTFKIRGIPFTIGTPGGTALTAGASDVDYITVPFACTIAGYNLVIDAGTITVKFWKKATGTAIPTSSDSISTSGVGISTGTAIHSTTTSDFTTTTVTANDIVAMKVITVASAAYVQGVLQCNQ